MIPPHFGLAYILQDIKMSTYGLVLLLFGHVVGQLQGVRFRNSIDLGLLSCTIHPSPSFGAWYVHLVSGFEDNVTSDFHRPMEIVEVFRVSYHETQPSCELNMSE